MKTLFIEAKDKDITLNPNLDLSLLPSKVLICYSIQYKALAFQLKGLLASKSIGSPNPRQVLGCSVLKSAIPILLVSNGIFHALNLNLQNKEVYICDGSKIVQLDKNMLENMAKKQKAALSRFLYEDQVGVLYSLKPGQNKISKLRKISNLLKRKYNKKFYNFLFNTLSLSELENFKINSWVNTACPGISLDNPKIINVSSI